MQLLATSEQMREYDRSAIERYGIPGIVLMENAGKAFVDSLVLHAGLLPQSRVAVVSGKGNNGGDGFVITRHLLNRGCAVDLFTLGAGDSLKGDAHTQWKVLAALSTDRLRMVDANSAADIPGPGTYGAVVDAMYGTGFAGALDGNSARFARWMNASGSFVAAVDVPSGVNANTGAVAGEAVRANLTVTMGLAKPGLYLGEGKERSGNVVVADIGIPAEVFRSGKSVTCRIEREDVLRWLPERAWNANKYTTGKVYVVAGSRSFTGAPVLTALAAMKAGAGAVVLGVPSSIHSIMAAKLTEVIIQPLEETPEGTVSPASRASMNERAQWADVVVAGPGLGRNAETDQFLRQWIGEIQQPLVLDADGLNAVAGHTNVLSDRRAETILTPHAGELSRLTGEDSRAIESRRIEAAREASARFNSTVVLKGAPTAIGWEDGTVVLNSSGNAGMATIGSGDVLTGIIAGLWAQGMKKHEASAAGVYLHGCAGDLAMQKLGIRSMQASDILQELSEAFHLKQGA